MLHLRVASLVSVVSGLNPAKVLLPPVGPIDIVTAACVLLLLLAGQRSAVSDCVHALSVLEPACVHTCSLDLWGAAATVHSRKPEVEEANRQTVHTPEA